jgi:uncharacterized protein YjiS (DUF1127 family)
MPDSIGFFSEDLEMLRRRLERMDDDQLKRFGRAAAYMSSPEAYFGGKPRPEFAVQLGEARSEWRRRAETKKTA